MGLQRVVRFEMALAELGVCTQVGPLKARAAPARAATLTSWPPPSRTDPPTDPTLDIAHTARHHQLQPRAPLWQP
jgi:hypothetical protein